LLVKYAYYPFSIRENPRQARALLVYRTIFRPFPSCKPMKTKKVKRTSYQIKIYFFNSPNKYLNERRSGSAGPAMLFTRWI